MQAKRSVIRLVVINREILKCVLCWHEQVIKEKRYGNRAMTDLNSVPVNFMTDTDITGGNSGSPTLNSKGELVGLAFDGNIESVAANWLFDPALKRTIHVDIRYILWVMEQVEPAPRLLKEMNVVE